MPCLFVKFALLISVKLTIVKIIYQNSDKLQLYYYNRSNKVRRMLKIRSVYYENFTNTKLP